MSPKLNRRKNSAPKRVIRVDDEEDRIYEKNTVVLPKDPCALAKYISDHNVTDFFQVPTVPDEFFDIVEKAKQEAVDGKEVIFKCSFCNEKLYRSAAGLHYHLMNGCSSATELPFICIICQKECTTADKMIEHIQDEHVYMYLGAPAAEAARRRSARQSRLKIQMFAESSSVAEELERHYSSLSDEDEKFEELPQEKETKKKEIIKDPDIVPKQPRSSGGTYTSIQSPLSEALVWTFNQKEHLEKKYPSLHPNMEVCTSQWLPIVTRKVPQTYQLHAESPAFYIEDEFLNLTRTGKRNSKNVITSKANGKTVFDDKLKKARDQGLQYEKIKLFKSTKASHSHKSTFYVGGPVWSMAWCPVANSMDSINQYLALCTHAGEHSLESQTIYQETVLLQLWNCGKLPARPEPTSSVNPLFAYGIALDVGPVWSLKWCPLADSVSNLTPNLQRLGILALACGSGEVHIYVLPNLNEDGQQPNSPSSGGIYSAVPHSILLPLRVGHFGQCMCVCWSLNDGANFVAAGFASGHIALWNMKKKSKFLTSHRNGSQIVYAFHTFRAHSKPVQDIVFCPFDSNYLVSVGADRCLKMWDQRNTEADIPNSLPPKMSVIYEVDWSLLWCGIYASTDSAFSIPYFHGSIFLNLGSTANTLQNVVPPKAASWSVTACDWLNSAAGGDMAGNVVVNVCNNWNRLFISNKSYPRIVLFQTDVEWETESGSTSYLRKPVHFRKDACSDYNLVFHDCDLSETIDKWKDTEAHLRVRTFEDFDDESYDFPVAAIHKVRWNPNLSSFTWIASATYSGLVRLHCVSGLVSGEVEECLSNCRPR